MDAESEEELAKLRERAELLQYKADALFHDPDDKEALAESRRISAEIRELNEKAEQIEDNIEDCKEKRKKQEAEEEASKYR